MPARRDEERWGPSAELMRIIVAKDAKDEGDEEHVLDDRMFSGRVDWR
jgi:hypothetical protein